MVDPRLEAAQTRTEQSRATLEILVPFTTPELTRAALRKAAELAPELHVKIRLIWVQLVPFPLPVGSPPVSIPFLRAAVRDMAARYAATGELYLARKPEAVWVSRMQADSLIVIATPRRPWRTRQEKLARGLRQNGHDVLLTYVR